MQVIRHLLTPLKIERARRDNEAAAERAAGAVRSVNGKLAQALDEVQRRMPGGEGNGNGKLRNGS